MIGMVKGTTRQMKQVAGLPAPIASFRTNMSGNIDSLKVLVEAQQDLHGYDKPWAGGGGSNKWDEEWRNGYYSNGAFVSNPNYVCSKNQITILPNTSYYAYNGESSGRVIIAQYDSNGDFISNILVRNAVFTTDSNAVSINFYLEAQLQTYQHNVAINYPSSVATYSPYENICPITGWSGANVTRTGKNVWNEQAESGSIIPATGVDVANANKIRSVGFISVKPNTTYNIVFADTTAGSDYLYYYKKDGTFINSESYVHTVSGNKTFTTPTDCYNLRFIMSLTEYNNKISVNYPSTDTAYHAYNGNTYTIAFGDTYYGGELDVTNGVLRVVKAIVDLGSLNWNTPTNRSTYYGLANIIKAPINAGVLCGAIAEKYHEVPSNSSLTTDGQFAVGTNGYLYFYRVTDTPTGMFVYPLATPFTIQLTPQQIEQLAENNVFADCGEISELKYQNRIITKLFSKG